MNLTKMKKFGKSLAGILVAGVLTSLAIFPALGMNAASPRFNFLYGDAEMFTGVKSGNEKFTDPVEGIDNGDSFAGKIYYHNGVTDSVAENTRISVVLPDALKKGDNLLTASISADNAETVTDTVINGEINPISGLTVKALQDLELDYVPGSVKWFPNANQTGAKQQPLPFGQTGSELFTANGLKIGDINGCWEYAGWVTFVAKAKITEAPEMQVTKNVENVTKATAYSKSVEADLTDKVNYKVSVKNAGNTTLDAVRVNDQLPLDLKAVEGTGIMNFHGVDTSYSVTDLLGTTGVTVGDMLPGEVAVLTFDASPDKNITILKTIRNIAIAKSGNLEDSDYADVVVKPGIIDTRSSKSAWNITRNVNAETSPAKPGDVIEYTLRTKNIGNADTEYVVEDGLSDVLEYAIVTDANGGSVNTGGMIVYPKAKLVAGGELVRTFKVQIKNPLPTNAANGTSYDFKMQNYYGNWVTVDIYKEVLTPVISIGKYVRNVTANEQTFVKANTAYAGDILEYKIVFKNSGNGPADYFKVSDVLPANVTLDTTSAAILGYGGEEKSISENIQEGFTLRTLAAGQEAYVRFRAVIGSGVANGEVLKNTAYLTDDGKILSDTAETVIKTKVVLIKTTPVPSLPRTGSADVLILALIAAIGGTGSLILAKEVIKR